jgi:RNA polymerase sigma factor FliA
MHSYAAPAEVSASDREQLILEHLPQVRIIARRIQERLPEHVSLDDLVSTGVLGLISAIDNFDPAHNVKLKTYAEYKIRGAILDSLRSLDWAPRQRRRRAKQIDAAYAQAEQRLQRLPAEDEIAAELRISLAEYHEWLVEIRGLNVASLDAGDANRSDFLQFLQDEQANLPSAIVERSELERLLAEGIDRIPAIERTVLSLYYHEELTLREIAQIVDLHESRISQLKAQAILRLRTYLARQWPATRGAAVA